MSQSEKDVYLQKARNNITKAAFKEYANKYYPRKQAKEMISLFNNKLKEKK